MTTHKCKKIIFTIDCDYEELVDAIGLDYSRHGTDLKIKMFLDRTELKRVFNPDPYIFAFNTLNPELAETCSDAKIYNPTKKDYLEYEID